MVVPLLGFIQKFADFPLRNISIFAQGTYAIMVVHRIHPTVLYAIQILSIDKNSIFEYNYLNGTELNEKVKKSKVA